MNRPLGAHGRSTSLDRGAAQYDKQLDYVAGYRVGLQNIWQLLRRHIRLMIGFVAIGMLLAAVLVTSLPKRYSTSAVVVLGAENTRFENIGARFQAVDSAIIQTEMDVLESRIFAEEVAERLGLFESTAFLDDNPPGIFETMVARAKMLVEFAVATVSGDDQAAEVAVSEDIAPASETATAADTPVTADPVVERETVAAVTLDESQSVESLTEQSTDLSPEGADPALLVDRERAVTKLQTLYRSSNSGNSLAIQVTATHTDPAFAARIANTVAATYVDYTVAIQREGIDSSVAFLSTRAEQLVELLTSLQLDLAALIRINALDDPNRTQAMLGELDSLRAMSDLGVQSEERRAQIAEQIARQTEALRIRTEAELERTQIELALQIEQERYQAVTERLSEFEAQRDTLRATARHVTIAQAPNEPSQPRVNLALAMAFVGLSALAFVLVLLREGLETRIWQSASAEALTGLPNLGNIPTINPRSVSRDMSLVEHLKTTPYSPFGQAMRSFITSAFVRTEDGSGKILMISSGLPREGKTTVSVSFGICAAVDGLRVLIIDLDVHSFGASRAFGLRPGADTVEEALSSHEAFKSAIRPNVQMQGLDVLNFSSKSHFSRRLGAGLEEERHIERFLRNTYDLILIDTPPYLIVDEANRLSNIVDSAVLVARWGQTNAQALEDTARLMLRNQIPLVGTVLNGIDQSRNKRYGYGGYASYYEHGKGYV